MHISEHIPLRLTLSGHRMRLAMIYVAIYAVLKSVFPGALQASPAGARTTTVTSIYECVSVRLTRREHRLLLVRFKTSLTTCVDHSALTNIAYGDIARLRKRDLAKPP